MAAKKVAPACHAFGKADGGQAKNCARQKLLNKPGSFSLNCRSSLVAPLTGGASRRWQFLTLNLPRFIDKSFRMGEIKIMQNQQNILQFNSLKEHYTADACIVWCFDDRFSGLLGKFIKNRGYKHYDLVKVAGGAKSLASPENEAERLFLLKQIRTSINLHNAKLVILMCHEDCGAYGGKKAFENDENEKEKICDDLKGAVHILKNNLPKEVGVEMVFANFDGIEKA